MRFTLVCRDVGEDRTREEAYEKDGVRSQEDAERWSQDTIDSFNKTLRPGERKREVVRVFIEEGTEGLRKEHAWGKTNLVTINKGGYMYDTAKCAVCGITGKRHGLGSAPQRDGRYKAKVYERCDTSFKKRFPKKEFPGN